MTKRALIVEDEPHVRLLMERVLSRAGWQVVTAADVASALQHVASVDVMVVDYHLGKERGSEVVRRARETLGTEPPPAMLVTGTPDEVPVAEWDLFAGSLPKPFKVEALVAAVEQLAKKARARSGTRRKASLFDVEAPVTDAKKDEAV